MESQSNNQVILVDQNDNQIGTAEKIEAHQKGFLHRAFSVFVFNSQGEILLQKRGKNKYHSPGLWSNACCSHPRPGKEIKLEAEKRLKHEMGIACPLKEIFTFHYRAEVTSSLHSSKKGRKKAEADNLIENEIDYVFLGKSDDRPTPNLKEVGEWRWLSVQNLKKDIALNPQNYTPWFKKALPRVIDRVTEACH